jgi:isochorismate synthase
MDNINQIIKNHLDSNTAFYAYRLPKSDDVHLNTIASISPFDLAFLDDKQTSNGFVMYPFDATTEQAWLFSNHETTVLSQKDKTPDHSNYSSVKTNPETHDFHEYSGQFAAMQQALNKGEVEKIILSRALPIHKNLIPALPAIFTHLLVRYPKAFVFMVSTPQTGIWTGASPELLFSGQNGTCTTVALAGTRTHDAAYKSWTQKEIEEQGLVSNFIDNTLNKFNITGYTKNGPKISRAGNLTHLKTTYNFNSPPSFKLAQFVKDLHPTPALCGEPKTKAMRLIRAIEKHNRSYYGGFLGPIETNNSQLFVNIRSMKTEAQSSTIFVGGGLTRQSNLHSEWNETILKSQTLLSIINKL